MKRVLFPLVTATLLIAVTGVLLYLSYPHIRRTLEPQLTSLLMMTMSDAERDRLYDRIAADTPGFWETIPEPLVARVGRRGAVVNHKQAEVRINNAGMRSSRPYGKKTQNTYRIICLGDSFVFGSAGKEEDRFCDQLEEFYGSRGITIDGKRIEAYAVGLGSWTIVQESTYLSRRLSEYDPDLIIHVAVSNDITDSAGVTGAGFLTNAFSPEHRDWGSAVFSNQAGARFGSTQYGALTTALSPLARDRWDKAMAALRRLVDLQHRRGKNILLSSLPASLSHYGRIFHARYRAYLQSSGIEAPYLLTRYLLSEDSVLPHDSHPSRTGHRYLRNQYVHALHRLGWIPVPEQELPALEAGQSVDFDRAPETQTLRQDEQAWIDTILKSSVDFGHLRATDTRYFLGGIFPQRRGKESFNGYPWASIRSAFLLKRAPGAERLEIKIEIPQRVELFPMHIVLAVNGQALADFDFPEWRGSSDIYTLETELPDFSVGGEVVEVLLTTDSYFAGIGDHRMRSYRLVSARVY